MIFCIGNGKSREAIDLHFLKKKGIIYGSNALYRDFSPDILVTSDPKMMEEIIESEYSKENKVYTTGYGYSQGPRLKGHNVSLIPFEKIYPVNSGFISVRLAYHFYPEDQIYMIGFDLFGDRKNIYDDSRNYPVSVSTSSVYHSQEDERVAQFSLLKTHFCLGIRLIRVIDDDTKVENIDNITTKQFLEEITWQ